MRLRTKLEKLEKELRASEGEVKIIIRHKMINGEGEAKEFKTQEIVLKRSTYGTEIVKGDNPQ